MPHHIKRLVLPFTAIVDQDKMKKALILNAINPRISGVLIRGQKGTGKSTAVRGLAELLPEIEVVDGCPFNCNPRTPSEMCDICYEKYTNNNELPVARRKVRIVDLPLNATVDRVAGTLDIKRAIKEGIKALEPGLLAEANRGILYVDEVNLLDDHVADILLDSAASGVNVVEREGISISHPAKFILIGTMNPEEGELRPQLLDRFGLEVEIREITNPNLRMEIVKRVEEFEADPAAFIKKHARELEELKTRITKARELLPKVQISDDLLCVIAETCSKLAVSNRAEIVITRTAKAIAAFNGRTFVTEEDIKEAMELALPHRMRKKPFEETQLTPQSLQESLTESQKNQGRKRNELSQPLKPETTKEQVFNVGEPTPIDFKVEHLVREKPRIVKSGRRIRIRSTDRQGTYVSSTLPRGKPIDVALDATIRAAAIHSKERGHSEQLIVIEDEDIREKVRYRDVSTLVILTVDASGSMAALRRMEAAKGAALALLQDAYIHRDHVAFITFRGTSAQFLLPPTNNINLAVQALAQLPTGGRTPLSAGLSQALELIRTQRLRRGYVSPIMVLITDGKANVPLKPGREIRSEIIDLANKIRDSGTLTIVIDTLPAPGKVFTFEPNYTKDIVEATNAEYIKLPELTAETLHGIIRNKMLSG